MPARRPSYLRAVVTTRCPMNCTYCHMEGDPGGARPARLDTGALTALLRVAARSGIHKFKFLGGEPLVRADMPDVIADLRRAAPTADLSVITAGVTLEGILDRCFDAGLTRANLSIHGFDLPAFARRGGNLRTWQQRNTTLEGLVRRGRPLKLNYVVGPDDLEDVDALLTWAAPRPVVVNLLDDLSDPTASSDTLRATLRTLRGAHQRTLTVDDPHSLATTHLIWSDGLRVEVKDRRLGDLAPWGACPACPKRRQCREGIFALRLTHDGRLQPCMDRPDLALDLLGVLDDGGEDAAARAWDDFVDALLGARPAVAA